MHDKKVNRGIHLPAWLCFFNPIILKLKTIKSCIQNFWRSHIKSPVQVLCLTNKTVINHEKKAWYLFATMFSFSFFDPLQDIHKCLRDHTYTFVREATFSVWERLYKDRLSSFYYISETVVSIANVLYTQTGKRLGPGSQTHEALLNEDLSHELFLSKSLLLE